MGIQTTKFYPVDVESRIIIDDPQRRERDVAWKYRGTRLIGISGKHLKTAKCYQQYQIVRTNTKTTRVQPNDVTELAPTMQR